MKPAKKNERASLSDFGKVLVSGPCSFSIVGFIYIIASSSSYIAKIYMNLLSEIGLKKYIPFNVL